MSADSRGGQYPGGGKPQGPVFPKTFGEYCEIVKRIRKSIDGRETYGKHTAKIRRAFDRRTSPGAIAADLAYPANATE